MNAKLWAGVIVIMVVLAGSGMYLSSNAPDDDKIVITARVNEEGSGIFAKQTDLVNRNADGSLKWDGEVISYNRENWIGKIIMSPGNQTIQHMMLMDIVENDLDLTFAEYSEKYSGPKEVVFYMSVAPANMKSVFQGKMGDVYVDGGITWESYFSDILDTVPTAKMVYKTGERNPDHTCCVVSVNRTFANTDSYSVIRFLAAYEKIVQWMWNAQDVDSPTYSEDYAKLVRICKDYTKITDDRSITDALGNVKYLYSDSDGSLDVLKTSIAELVDDFGAPGQNILKYTPQELGFADSTAFANWLVDDWYIQQAQYVNPANIVDWRNIRVTVLTGDLHGIAMKVGTELGIFREFKLNVTVNEVTNGPAAMDLLLSGNTDVGIIGAPPSVIKQINMYK